VIRSGVSLDEQAVVVADENGRRDTAAAGRRAVSRRRQEPRPRWGEDVVSAEPAPDALTAAEGVEE
jgi:hypothetical protein